MLRKVASFFISCVMLTFLCGEISAQSVNYIWLNPTAGFSRYNMGYVWMKSTDSSLYYYDGKTNKKVATSTSGTDSNIFATINRVGIMIHDSLLAYYTEDEINTLLSLKVNYTDTSIFLTPYLRKTDTASLSTRIILKLNISDTANMLNPYLRKIDTASLSNRINTKMAYADTASLSNRINSKMGYADTASLSNRINLKLNISDTGSMLSTYLRKIDTLGLSNRINLKLNISDTASMLSKYLRSSDTTSMLSKYLRKTDTATLSSRIDLKLNIADTGNMLSPYLRKIDTSTLSNRINLRLNIADTGSMLSNYLRKIDTSTLSARINLKLNISDSASMLSKYLRKVNDTLSGQATIKSNGTSLYSIRGLGAANTVKWSIDSLGNTSFVNVVGTGNLNMQGTSTLQGTTTMYVKPNIGQGIGCFTGTALGVKRWDILWGANSGDTAFYITRLPQGLSTSDTAVIISQRTGRANLIKNTFLNTYTDKNNSGTTETTLDSTGMPAYFLDSAGQTMAFDFSGKFNNTIGSKNVKVYFNGTAILDIGTVTITGTGTWIASGYIKRTGATTARATTYLLFPFSTIMTYTAETDLTGITFTSAVPFKLTATSGNGSSDITEKDGRAYFKN